jgi:hypothetical protein
MSGEKARLLFLVVRPTLATQTHAGQRRDQWPGSFEITAAMLERSKKRPAS